jgi:hypothetical protein
MSVVGCDIDLFLTLPLSARYDEVDNIQPLVERLFKATKEVRCYEHWYGLPRDNTD